MFARPLLFVVFSEDGVRWGFLLAGLLLSQVETALLRLARTRLVGHCQASQLLEASVRQTLWGEPARFLIFLAHRPREVVAGSTFDESNFPSQSLANEEEALNLFAHSRPRQLRPLFTHF